MALLQQTPSTTTTTSAMTLAYDDDLSPTGDARLILSPELPIHARRSRIARTARDDLDADASFVIDLDSSIITRKSLEDEGWVLGSRPLLKADAGKLEVKWNDRVHFYTNTGDLLTGTVRWIGKFHRSELENSKTSFQIFAGLELDVPLGDGNGSFRDAQLFWTEPDHAFFIQLDSLTKGEGRFSGKKAPKPKTKSPRVSIAYTQVPCRHECVVCYAADVSQVFIPCGHAHTCDGCTQRILSEDLPTCPTCRSEVDDAQEVFF